MSAQTIIWVVIVIIAVVAIVAVGYFVSVQQRRQRLRTRFGPEYDRTVAERENRREAEQDLLAREKRHSALDIRPLEPAVRQAYDAKWADAQERFVDAPGRAVNDADRLVTDVLAERGYPIGDDLLLSDLSVEHGATVDRYRRAHEISDRAARRLASTEELRQAMVDYRSLFDELLAATPAEARAGETSEARTDQTAEPQTAKTPDRTPDDAGDHPTGRHTPPGSPGDRDNGDRAHDRNRAHDRDRAWDEARENQTRGR